MTEEENLEINLLELIPRRNIDFEADDDGMITLLTPRFRNRFLVKYLQPRLKCRHFKVDLDEIGSFVWLRCTGDNTAADILKELRDNFGEDIEPAIERLKLFFEQLERLKFIEFINIEECSRDKDSIKKR